MRARNQYRTLGILLGILGVVLFSTKAVLVKLAYRYDIDTLELLLFRMLFSVPFYAIILLSIQGKKKQLPTRKDMFWIVVFGFLGYYMASYFDFLGLNYIKAGLERIILFVYPTIVVVLGYIFFKDRISKTQAVAIGITYAGVLVTFWSEIDLSGSKTLWGGFLVLLSAITYASYLVGSGWLIPKYGVMRFTCYSMIVSTFCVVVHYGVYGNWQLWDFPAMVYVYGILMAIISTLIPSFLVSESIKRLGASNFSILGSLGPVSTIILAYIFLGEQLTYIQLLGMLVVIGGVTFLSLKVKSKK
ncbi:MAG: DMT family transporter [Bacteroidota bacterium]